MQTWLFGQAQAPYSSRTHSERAFKNLGSSLWSRSFFPSERATIMSSETACHWTLSEFCGAGFPDAGFAAVDDVSVSGRGDVVVRSADDVVVFDRDGELVQGDDVVVSGTFEVVDGGEDDVVGSVGAAVDASKVVVAVVAAATSLIAAADVSSCCHQVRLQHQQGGQGVSSPKKWYSNPSLRSPFSGQFSPFFQS